MNKADEFRKKIWALIDEYKDPERSEVYERQPTGARPKEKWAFIAVSCDPLLSRSDEGTFLFADADPVTVFGLQHSAKHLGDMVLVKEEDE
jgi:hypothetical protein